MYYAYLEDSFIDILSQIFRTLFNDVLTPILTDILTVFINYFTNVIWNMLSGFLVLILAMLCSLIDFIENIFNVFAGIAPVLVKGEPKPMYLLDALFQMEAVSKAFLYITLMSVAICFIFTIYKTVKSISDMALEDKNPVSKVMKDGLKATFTFMLIPFLCVLMLQLSSVVTSQINNSFTAAQGGQSGSVGTILFLSVSMDADQATTETKDLISGTIKMESGRNPSLGDELRSQYMSGKKDYRDMDTVKADFHAANFNYITGFVGGILLLIVMAVSVLTFIRRLFELLLLYIVSPLYVSTIPLDDGATFAKWRELFVAKFFSGFGSVFIMKLYLIMIPMISGSNLILYDRTLPNGSVINNVLQLFLVIGGAWAVFKGQSILMQIFSPQAGMTESQASDLLMGAIAGGATIATGGAAMAAKGATMAAGKGMAGAIGGGSSNSDKNQAYRGK